ncbi:hypothetical protein PAMP_020026 [Pampus punctatissimus]
MVKTYCRLSPSTFLRQPGTTCTISSFLSPAALLLQHNPALYHFPAGLSITGKRPPLSSRESPRGQLIMDLNAAHYPDKAGAVAGQWLPDWLDDSHTALTVKEDGAREEGEEDRLKEKIKQDKETCGDTQ